MLKIIITVTLLLKQLIVIKSELQIVDPKACLLWGPGLKPDEAVLPTPYFFIQAVDRKGHNFTESPPLQFEVNVTCNKAVEERRQRVNVFDRGDGTTLVRYKLDGWCDSLLIAVHYNDHIVAEAPYLTNSTIYSASCYCPKDLNLVTQYLNCPHIKDEKQILSDLRAFPTINFTTLHDNIISRYNYPESISLCHYVVLKQQIYRRCFGKYTGFKMFMDATLRALAHLALLPDMEFYLNLGDWPLVKKSVKPVYPLFAWCGSIDTYDIVLPTYDITESTLESMDRVTLDMLSVQESYYPWREKIDKAFWRGRDSSRERLQLIDLAREYPDFINASITNFFFFRNEESKYGPKVPHVSFFDFFQYKYQINIDGTVASYRFPYLMAGDSLVFKQESPFYEHFYSKLKSNHHYILVNRNLSNLVAKLKWAKSNEQEVRKIISNARNFVERNLMPQHIYCYHLILFQEWSKRLLSPVQILPDMEKVPHKYSCKCKDNPSLKEEL